jgi:hypothetical protein
MSQPKPIDVNRLKGILGGAKAVMNKVDEGSYSKGNVHLDESVNGNQLIDANQAQSQGYHQQQQPQQPQQPRNVAPKMNGGQANYKNIENSKLPDNIKQAMMENPIPQLSGPNHTFNLEDVDDLVEKPMPMNHRPNTRVNENVQQQQPIQQNANDTFTVSESTLVRIVEDIIDKKLNNFMTETYNKTLTEQAIKKTINTLIKEGKVKTKKKVNG